MTLYGIALYNGNMFIKRVIIWRLAAWGVTAIGVLLAVTAGLSALHSHSAPRIPPGVSSTMPSAIKPTPQAIASYTVPATNPKYIAIPAIGVKNTPVVKLGITKTGAIAAPDTIYSAGWYSGSSLPGQTGAMFIYGHVSTWQAKGVFFDLKRLKPGDRITVVRGDNKNYTYQVVGRSVYPYNAVDMGQVLSPVNTRIPGLNLMTCTGSLITGTSEFSERLVVFASLVST